MQNEARIWTAEQRQYMDWLALPKALRQPKTDGQFATQLGVNQSTLWRWRQIPGFADELRRQVREQLKSEVPEIYEALVKEAKKGDVPAIKLALEITGDYVPSQKIDANVQQTLTWADVVKQARAEVDGT